MDPVSTVVVDTDTSFALMLEAQRRGHRVDHCLASDIYLADDNVWAHARRATMQRDPVTPITLGEQEQVNLADTDAVFIRTDPPFDRSYLWLTLLLEHVRGKTLLVNDPAGLRNANEKLYACHFPELMPATLVDSHADRIKAFLEHVGGQGVIKPIDGFGGDGVFALSLHDKNLNGLIEMATQHGTQLTMVQAFLPAVAEGDKRILLIDGEPLGAFLRVPKANNLRSNLHAGGRAVHAELNKADQHIIQTLAPALRRDGLFFVGLDVIGGRLTEVNVTSPTGMQQMGHLQGAPCEPRVLAWTEQAAATLNALPSASATE